MISTKSKLAIALGVFGVIALSMPSAQADSARKQPTHARNHHAAHVYHHHWARVSPSVRGAYAAQRLPEINVESPFGGESAFGYGSPYGNQFGPYGPYNMPIGGGINVNDGRNGANWNRNQ